MWSCIILMEDYAFSVWELLSVGLTGYSTCWNESFGFPEKGYNRGFPANPTIYTTSPSLDEDWHLVWLVMTHFGWPQITSIPYYCTVSTFHLPSQFVLKTEHSCYISVENITCKICFFFLLNLCGTKISKRLTYPSWCKWFSVLDLDILSMLAISHIV